MLGTTESSDNTEGSLLGADIQKSSCGDSVLGTNDSDGINNGSVLETTGRHCGGSVLGTDNDGNQSGLATSRDPHAEVLYLEPMATMVSMTAACLEPKFRVCREMRLASFAPWIGQCELIFGSY